MIDNTDECEWRTSFLSSKGLNFAIVGGGLSATAMLCQFVNKVQNKAEKKLLDPSQIIIQVFERGDIFGPGFPHNDRFVLPFHITNMCAFDMGILDGHPGDFQQWVTRHANFLQDRFTWFADFLLKSDNAREKCSHYPRAVMGEYLKFRFQQAFQFGRKIGLQIDLYPLSEVIDLRQEDDLIRLNIKDVKSESYFSKIVNRVLLATGHWFHKNDLDQYFDSPWPANDLLRDVPQGEKVAIIGTSLSAIETVLTLTSEGEFIRSDMGELLYRPPEDSRSFVLYSRRGLLPKVRGKMGDRANKFLNRKTLMRLLSANRGDLSLDTIFNLLNSDLEEAYGQPVDWEKIYNPTEKPADLLQGYLDDAIHGDGPNGELIWQTVLHQSFDIVRDIYLNLTLRDRRQFDRNYTSVFFTHAATMPAINAEKLLALIKAGIVEVRKLGTDYCLKKYDEKERYEFIYRDVQGNEQRDIYRYVVNARGQEKSLKTNPSTLAKNLLASEIVQIEEFRHLDQINHPNREVASTLASTDQVYKTGSIWIDPETHQIMKKGPDKKITKSNTIYAAGAMTRGQIIDASTVSGIVQATALIAENLVKDLMEN
ncbi:MAG: FAD/NAD(P)-binding protein, partial [Deltaproteobacteria bacterium]|nr:FAD/NAD(P)-binding protein [Deltaproteobacteria bacterium]